MQTLGSTLSNTANRGISASVAFNRYSFHWVSYSHCKVLVFVVVQPWESFGAPFLLTIINYKHQLQKQVKPQQTPIAQQTNRVRYAVYGTQYPVSTARYMVLSPAAHRGKSSTTAKKWREIKGLEWLCNSLQPHP